MIITIDGPAGAGKSSAACALANRLGFRFLDTGAMYRAVAYVALQRGVDLEDTDALDQLTRQLDIRWQGQRLLVDGQDVTDQIRTSEITDATRHAANHPGVRDRLVELQRAEAAGQSVVTEGRDQGTLVFPHAECKVFLTASEEVRAERRYQDLVRRGESVTRDDVLRKQRLRDQQDATRPVGRLIQADDAVVLNTDGMSHSEVVDRLLEIVAQRR